MITLITDWLSGRKYSTYGVAVTRMIVGFVVASQLLVNWPDRHYTWGDGARWADPVSDAKSWPGFLAAFRNVDGLAFDVLYLATIAVATLMALGLATRVATIATLVLYMSLYVSNPFVGSGGDAVLRMVMLYLCFTDAGGRWSIDARFRRQRDPVGRTDRALSPWFGTTLHNLAVILIVHQVVMVYVASALWKVQSERWMDGTAVYYPLQTEAYSPWGDVLHPLFAAEPIIVASTWAAIAIQLFVPVLLLYRPTRVAALIALTGMHLGIGLSMGIMYFSLVMIAVDMILVSDSTWLRIFDRFAASKIGFRLRKVGYDVDRPA